MEKKFSPHLNLAKKYWEDLLTAEDLAIDATSGNGHDTLFLAKICSVVALDIQEQAIEKTQKLLESHQSQAELHLLSHVHINTLILKSAPKLIVYNLGYLPGADKSITTKNRDTLLSVQKSLKMLAAGGALCITCYPGHDEGLLEEQALEKWIQSLDTNRWDITHHKWEIRPRAPSLIWIRSVQ